MATVRVVLSIQQPLLEKIDALVRELEVSRSHLFVLAVEDFIQRHQNRQLLESINEAYSDLPDPEEQRLRRHMLRRHRQMMEGEQENAYA